MSRKAVQKLAEALTQFYRQFINFVNTLAGRKDYDIKSDGEDTWNFPRIPKSTRKR